MTKSLTEEGANYYLHCDMIVIYQKVKALQLQFLNSFLSW